MIANGMTQILYTNNIQPENRRIIQEHINGLLWLLPGWLHLLRVNLYDSGDTPGELASISVMYDYREATLNMCCGWLDESPEHKMKAIVHELLHIHLNVLSDYAESKIDVLCPKDEQEKFNASIKADLRERLEYVTHDLAKVLCDKMEI